MHSNKKLLPIDVTFDKGLKFILLNSTQPYMKLSPSDVIFTKGFKLMNLSVLLVMILFKCVKLGKFSIKSKSDDLYVHSFIMLFVLNLLTKYVKKAAS